MKSEQQKGLELRDIVSAPLQAIAEANIKLSANIVDFLCSTGDANTDSLGKSTINLRTVQMLYEQVRNDADENTVADTISLEVPLLSIYPLSTLKVAKSKVAFGVNIRGVQANQNGQTHIYGELAGQPGVKAQGNRPQVSFEVELEGVPAAEGLARFVDTLNSNALPKQLARRPLDESGNKLTGEALNQYEQNVQLAKKQRRLQAHLAEADTMLRQKNNELRLATGMEYDEIKNTPNPEGYGEGVDELLSAIEEFVEIKAGLEQTLAQLRAAQLRDGFSGEA